MYDKIEEAILERWGDILERERDSKKYAKEHLDEYAKEYISDYVEKGISMGEAIGIKIGEARGIEIGETNATEKIVKSMIDNGIDISLILKITNLSIGGIINIKIKNS